MNSVNDLLKEVKGGFGVASVTFSLLIFFITEGFIFLQSKFRGYVRSVFNTA